jgi:hypothetical protein
MPGEAVMIVHDFVSIDRGAAEVAEQFTHLSEPTLGVLVRSAWNDHRDTWSGFGLVVPPVTADGPPNVTLGPARARGDAVVMPHTWQADDACPCFPHLDADLELASFGPLSQVHLVGHYRLLGHLDQWTLETAPLHRATIVAIRSYLQLVAELLETGCSSIRVTASSVHLR